MFPTDLTRDDLAKRSTRRAFLAAGGIAAASVAFLVLRKTGAAQAGSATHGTPGEVTIVDFDQDGKNLGAKTLARVLKSDAEWLKQLGRNSFDIAREADTEMPYSGVSWKEHRVGMYRCVCCDLALFDSKTKFESGTGWPSFYAAIAKENVLEVTDGSMGMSRSEVKCTLCEGHLGHVFNDGPEPTGLRYCMNSASMRFAPLV